MSNYYVATNGNNAAVGSETAPWRTISYAMQTNLKPGDQVIVKSGTYTEQVSVNKGGSSTGDVTLRSETPGGAHIVAPAGTYSAVNIRANYVVVDGFDIKGGSGHGVDAQSVHHTRVLNNVVHDSGGSGIQYNYSEFITIDGNETYNNASTNGYQTSGISIYQSRNITGDKTTAGFRTVVSNNSSHDNVESRSIAGEHTDGNGIIIDDFQSTQTSGFANYTFPTLVENNLVYDNGGKGIQVTWSDGVTVRNNTAWHNNLDNANTGTWRAELSNQQSSDNTWINNIAVSDPKANANNTAIGNYSYGGYANTGTKWYNNLTFNGTVGSASVKTDGGNAGPGAADGNKLGVDPMIVAPGSDFHTRSGSPAIDAGTAKYGLSSTDLDGAARSVGTVDIGAYEAKVGAVQPPSNPTPAPATILGTSGNDILTGTSSAETIYGLDGNDTLNGKDGIDTLWGGAGKDVFVFDSKTAANGDAVADFVHAVDKIEVSAIDARTSLDGNQAFTFLGYAGGASRSGQLWAVEDASAGVTHVYANLGGTTAAEFKIDLKGVHLGLTASDFYL